MMSGDIWLIWSELHGRWWAPHETGYTTSIREAGRYPTQRAREIVKEANIAGFNEIAIPLPPAIPAPYQV